MALISASFVNTLGEKEAGAAFRRVCRFIP
jgi:hypothetical protein